MLEIVLSVILGLIALILILLVLAQPSKNPGFQGEIPGANDNMGSKNRGLQALFKKLTVVFTVLFFLLTVVLAVLVAN